MSLVSESQPVIVFDKLSFAYNGQVILQDVSFSLAEREFVSVVGPNGGGKTTLLKLILGLIHPIKGSVKIFGEEPHHVRYRIGYMAQYMNFDPKFPMSVRETVLMGRLGNNVRWRFSREDKRLVQEKLEMVGLPERADDQFVELSGGQRQRVLLARALVSEPELLLLDEPTANIDVVIGGKLYDILIELNKHLTIVLVSHDLGFVSQAVNRVLCVNKQVRNHPTSEISGEIIQEIYGREMHMVRHDKHSHSCG